jgi:ketosteroid isomerase-like protein
LLKKAQAVVQKTARKNVMSTGLIFFFFSVFLMEVMGGKITTNLKELH